MKIIKFLSFLVLVLVLTACSGSCSEDALSGGMNLNGQNRDILSLVTWNVQTFFDGEKDGSEYSDFQKSGNWNREKYSARLERLCNVITALNADVFVLEEIENEGILRDVSNYLSGTSWKAKNLYSYSCFAKPAGTGIGIGILSKYELTYFTSHSLDIRTQKVENPSMRYLIQVTIDIDGRELVLFANHWKSMSGSKEDTEVWRDWQESLLADRLIGLKSVGILPAVACGDFNRDIGRFVKEKQTAGDILLRCSGFGKRESISVLSPWYSANGALSTEIGSYWFQEKWERIDHVFALGEVEILSFAPAAFSPWATDGKIPIPYKISTGEGYSDHLPLLCKIRLK